MKNHHEHEGQAMKFSGLGLFAPTLALGLLVVAAGCSSKGADDDSSSSGKGGASGGDGGTAGIGGSGGGTGGGTGGDSASGGSAGKASGGSAGKANGGKGGTTATGGDGGTGGTGVAGTGTAGKGGSGGTSSGTSTAAEAAKKLGRAPNFLIGMGNDLNNDHNQDGAYTLGVTMDIHYAYLVGLPGEGGWPDWNSGGTFVNILTDSADAHGTTPMFDLYAMAAHGEAQASTLQDSSYMSKYWDSTKLMFERLGEFDKPAIAHIEPDFWAFFQQQSGGDPSTIPVLIHDFAPDCADQPDPLVSVADNEEIPVEGIPHPFQNTGEPDRWEVLCFIDEDRRAGALHHQARADVRAEDADWAARVPLGG